MNRRLSRRSLLQSASALSAFTILPSGLARAYAANEAVNVGIIGVGGQGKVNRDWLKRDGANIVALCDVDRQRLEQAGQEHPGAKKWVDYRQMLESQKEIDAVMISTTDHVHAPASIMAMKLGKHVCTEKPLTHSVWEARQLGILARQCKVATQLDNENHSTDGLRMVVDWVRAGVIGTVREVHIWTDRPIWPQGLAQRPPTETPPSHLEWDLWIGPAPYRPYHKHLHPFAWRGWWDFGCGALGDMGCHFFDSAFWSLELGNPTTVEAVHEGNSKETFPDWAIITYQFPARASREFAGKQLSPLTLKWYDGGKLPPRPEGMEADRRFPTNGSMFVGEKGTILVSDARSPRLIPESRMKDFTKPQPVLPRSPGHKLEWLAACKGGKPAGSNFTDFGGPLTEVVLLGNLAIRAGKTIEWDPINLKAKNAPELDPYIRREYRKGWEV